MPIAPAFTLVETAADPSCAPTTLELISSSFREREPIRRVDARLVASSQSMFPPEMTAVPSEITAFTLGTLTNFHHNRYRCSFLRCRLPGLRLQISVFLRRSFSAERRSRLLCGGVLLMHGFCALHIFTGQNDGAVLLELFDSFPFRTYSPVELS